jgi:hypothetical protein
MDLSGMLEVKVELPIIFEMFEPTHQMTLNHTQHVETSATQLVGAPNLTQCCHSNEYASVPTVTLCNLVDTL